MSSDERQEALEAGQRQAAEVARIQKQVKATTRELKVRLDYLDQLAREHEIKLNELRTTPPSPQRDARMKRIEQKLKFYHAVKHVADGADRLSDSKTQPLTQGTKAPPARVTNMLNMLSVKSVEAEAIIAGARILLEELGPAMKVVAGVVGLPANYNPTELAQVNRIKARSKGAPMIMQRLQFAYQQFSEAGVHLTQTEQQFERLKSMQGREALQFLQNAVRAPQLAGKLYHLNRLHIDFAGDPDLAQLFPAPQEVAYPAPSAEPPLDDASRPKTKGGLMGLFGLNKK